MAFQQHCHQRLAAERNDVTALAVVIAAEALASYEITGRQPRLQHIDRLREMSDRAAVGRADFEGFQFGNASTALMSGGNSTPRRFMCRRAFGPT